MKKVTLLLIALFTAGLLASCSSSTQSSSTQPTAQKHDMKGEMDYKGELRQG